MSEVRGLRLTTSAALKEQRLAALLREGRPDAAARAAIEDAQVAGSLELAGLSLAAEETGRLRSALRAVDPGASLSVAALVAWHRAATGEAGYRTSERSRIAGPAPAPPSTIAGRLAILEQWMNADSARQLKPAEQGALVMARVIEILPFEDGNGRVARLAASHLMVQAGARPPLLGGSDRVRLEDALSAAFRLETQALTALLAEASERALDLMIAALEGR